MAPPLLELDRVTVSFDGFKALNELSFTLPAGGVKVLIGPNGSGKSTVLDTIIGKVQPVSGKVVFRGKEITNVPEHRIAQMGIRRKFQAPGVLGNLTVQDNLAVAVRKTKGLLGNLRIGLTASEKDRVEEVLEIVGLEEKRSMLASQLSHGEKQWLEIGMVVGSEPELLLLDEPTAGMTTQESAQTATLIKRLADRHTVLVIDHDMAFVEQLDAMISVLYAGRLLTQGDMRQIRNDPEVVSVYLGRPQIERRVAMESHATA